MTRFPTVARLLLAVPLLVVPGTLEAVEAHLAIDLSLSGEAAVAGEIRLTVTPVGGAPTQLRVPVTAGASAEQLAGAIAQSFEGALGSAYTAQLRRPGSVQINGPVPFTLEVDAAAVSGITVQQQPAQGAGSRLAEEGLFPKSLRIPGTDVYVSPGGFVKLDLLQDLDPIGNAYQFKVNSIPVEGTSAADQGGQTTFHVRETRFSLDVRSKPGAELRAYFEGDFFGDDGDFRIRHAYGQYGRLLAGQEWSTFMDISARPLTVDYEGPDAEVFVRQAMVRSRIRSRSAGAGRSPWRTPAPRWRSRRG